jgi:hypothetical protein
MRSSDPMPALIADGRAKASQSDGVWRSWFIGSQQESEKS